VWRNKGEWDKALLRHEEALKLAEELGDRQVQANNLCNIGLVWQDKGEWDKAVGFHVRALAMFAQLGAPYEQGLVGGDLAECMKAMGRETFIAACEKAGMKKEGAEKLVEALSKSG
jgi:tetratricopeptide (TPR) repeat protein